MKKKSKKGVKSIISSIFYIIVAFLYIIKGLLHFIDKTIPRLFLKSPRLFQQCVIYTMVILSITCFLGRNYEVNGINHLLDDKNVVEVKEMVENEVIEDSQETKCQLSDIECLIYDKAISQNLSEEQSYMIMAISKHETGNWTSKAFKNDYNMGGIMNGNSLKTYKNINDGINDMIHILKEYYFNQGLNTLEKIQKKYCPIGAKNDPNGLNQYWLKNTTIFYNEYLGGK